MANKLRLMVVDDHRIVRAGLLSLLADDGSVEVVAEAANGREALEKARCFKPDVVLMDITMPVMGGIEATRAMTSELPATKVIALSVHDDPEFLFPSLRAGASGYVLKDTGPDELLSAIRAVSQGSSYLSPSLTKDLVENVVSVTTNAGDDAFNTLTTREREVLKLAAEGKTTREMAAALFLSKRTIEKHRQSGMHKLGFVRREELTRYALKKGLIAS